MNGPAGNANATARFQASPGYNWQRDQAVDAVARRGNALGDLGGNTLAAITDRASNLANNEYGGWQSKLAGFVPQEAGAVGGVASGLSNLFSTDAQNRAGVAGNVVSGIANSNTNAANAQLQANGNMWNGLFSLGGNVAKGYFAPGAR